MSYGDLCAARRRDQSVISNSEERGCGLVFLPSLYLAPPSAHDVVVVAAITVCCFVPAGLLSWWSQPRLVPTVATSIGLQRGAGHRHAGVVVSGLAPGPGRAGRRGGDPGGGRPRDPAACDGDARAPPVRRPIPHAAPSLAACRGSRSRAATGRQRRPGAGARPPDSYQDLAPTYPERWVQAQRSKGRLLRFAQLLDGHAEHRSEFRVGFGGDGSAASGAPGFLLVGQPAVVASRTRPRTAAAGGV